MYWSVDVYLMRCVKKLITICLIDVYLWVLGTGNTNASCKVSLNVCYKPPFSCLFRTSVFEALHLQCFNFSFRRNWNFVPWEIKMECLCAADIANPESLFHSPKAVYCVRDVASDSILTVSNLWALLLWQYLWTPVSFLRHWSCWCLSKTCLRALFEKCASLLCIEALGT
jgi:hypothetical protein